MLLVRTPLAHASTFDVQAPILISESTRREGQNGRTELQDGISVPRPASASAPKPTRVQYAPPEGFEDLDGPVQTFFDIYYLDKRVGLYEGTLDGGKFVFSNPAEIALRLPDVLPAKVEALLSQPLDSHEALRCLPGDQTGCGTLVAGESGIVVDPERFRINLFLGRDFLSSAPQREILLGNPVSGPSLIQNIAGSISSSSQASDSTRFGLVLDTYASLEKTSVVSRINADDSRGFRWQEAYAQHYFSKVRVAGGLIQEEGSANLDSSMFYGAEVSSFDRRDRSRDQSSGTPVDVVLPTASRVEIYRNGTLISARQYPAGLQILDTNNLPIGSYPIRIVARDASGIILDETRTFSKTPDLPPPGETNYTFRAGVRATEGGLYSADETGQADFLPESTGESIISASATRRLSQSTAATIGVTAVDGEIYPEAEFQIYRGDLRAVAALALGPDNQYSAVANVNFRVGDVISSISARQTEAHPLVDTDRYDPDIYRPFFQSERSVFGSLSMPVNGGSLGLRAGYSESDLASQRETFGLSYTRPFRNNRFGHGILAFDAVSSNEETRMGIRLTFRRSVERNASVNGSAGFDYSKFDSGPDATTRTDPLAILGYTRSGQYLGAAVSGNVNAGTSNGDTSLIFDGVAASRRGEVDVATGISRARDDDEAEIFLASNIQTGFIYGDSKLHVGTLGFGNAAVLVDVPESDDLNHPREGRFKVIVGSQESTSVRVGQSASILVPSLTNARVGLVPEGAPPFDIDLTPREVPLYPGNVVRMTWKASYIVSAIGRIVDSEGRPLANAIVQTSSDLAVTNREGYFSISGKVDDDVRVRTYEGIECGSVAQLLTQTSERKYLRLGDLTCQVDQRTVETKPDEAREATTAAMVSPGEQSDVHELETSIKVSALTRNDVPSDIETIQDSSSVVRNHESNLAGTSEDMATRRRRLFRKAALKQDIHFLMRPVARVYLTPVPRPIFVRMEKDAFAQGAQTRRPPLGWRGTGTYDRRESGLFGRGPGSGRHASPSVLVRNLPVTTRRLEAALARLERLKSAFDARDLMAVRSEVQPKPGRDWIEQEFAHAVFHWLKAGFVASGGDMRVSMKEPILPGI
ncbi:TcfC E-set like domain-containing protein [Hyphomonas sp.]|uniref:TcfC E-set like domain-containing protein n=1 Tax=Hyphomonas sp. TaxID=87 RepID=UPI0032D8BD24